MGSLPAAPFHVLSVAHQAFSSDLHDLLFTGDETQHSVGIIIALQLTVTSGPGLLRHQSTY